MLLVDYRGFGTSTQLRCPPSPVAEERPLATLHAIVLQLARSKLGELPEPWPSVLPGVASGSRPSSSSSARP